MQAKRFRKIVRDIFAVAIFLFMASGVARAQQGRRAAPSSATPPEPTAEFRALSELIHDLQSQVSELNSQLVDLRDEQRQMSEEARLLRHELDLAKARALPEPVPQTQDYSTSLAKASGAPVATVAPTAVPQNQSVSDRISKLEENQEIADARINEQYQTKVESGSKYRLRFSGIVLLNMYANRGVVDNQDYPQAAEPPQIEPLFVSPGSFGGSLRQSQIKMEAFGPELAGAHTSANLEFDFAGGAPSIWNGAVTGIVRLRTAVIRLDWNNTSLIGGQDRLFFAPLSPTSLATMASPAFSYSGNLWSWAPQVRVEHRMHISEGASVTFQAGILDSLTGDLPVPGYNRYPSWGEESGQPAYATRVSLSDRVLGQNLVVGIGGYYGLQNWGFHRMVDGWAWTSDVTLPLGKLFELTGAFYRGRAVAGFGGGIGQTVVLDGSFVDPSTTFKGLDSMGGWAQLKFKPKTNLEINAALGIDNPFANQIRRYKTYWVYPEMYSRNLTPMVNFIYQMRSDILFSTEYRHLQTSVLDSGSNSANHINMSLGYIF